MLAIAAGVYILLTARQGDDAENQRGSSATS